MLTETTHKQARQRLTYDGPAVRAESTAGTREAGGPGARSGIVQLAPEPVGSGSLDLQSLTELLASCSGALADSDVHTSREDMGGTRSTGVRTEPSWVHSAHPGYHFA